ncbi:hypothetical protein [Nocardioides pacificus]
MTIRLRPIAGLAVAATVLLSGCGTSPGSAVNVEGTTVSMGTLDERTADACEALETQLPEGQFLSLASVRSTVAQQALVREVVTQIGDEYGVQASSAYDDVEAQIREESPDVSEDLMDTWVSVNAGNAYYQDVLGQVGEQALEDEGEEVSPEAAAQRGQEIFTEWLADHDIQVDPRFGFDVTDEGLTEADYDTSVSVAVSGTAKAALADLAGEGESYAASLPQSQRCG